MLPKKRRNLIFLEAAILTLVIYTAAFFINVTLDRFRETELNNAVLESEISLGATVLNNMISNFNCEGSELSLLRSYKEIKKFGDELTDYGPLMGRTNQTLMKRREYFLKEIELLNRIMKYNKKGCPKILPIIYFYTPSGSIDKQSLILEQFWLNHKNRTFILPFDYTFSEPNINFLIRYYKVSGTPFIVIGNYTTRNLGGSDGLVSLNALTVAYKRIMKNGNYSNNN